jgi:hypothetical protein
MLIYARYTAHSVSVQVIYNDIIHMYLSLFFYYFPIIFQSDILIIWSFYLEKKINICSNVFTWI